MRDDRVLLFDLGGVLVESSGLAALGHLLPHIGQEEIHTRWSNSKSIGQFERGRISPEVFASLFIAEWQLRQEPAEFINTFATWVRGFFPGAASLISNLRARHMVGCLSNTNATHWAELIDVQNAFDVCIASHLIGHMKPDRAAYECALQRLGVAPGNVYFFDDLAPNIEAARSLGINAFRVRGLAETQNALRSIGIDTGAFP